MNSRRLMLLAIVLSGMHFPQLIYATSIQSSESNIRIDTIGSEPFFGEDPDKVQKEYEDAQKAEEAKKAAEAVKIQPEPGQVVEIQTEPGQPAPGQAVQVQTPPSGAPGKPVPSTSKTGESNESKQKGNEKGINYGY